jgi:hypothetical protein
MTGSSLWQCFGLNHRVSLETVDTVLTFTLPSLQRGIDDDHVRAMVEDQRTEFDRRGYFSLLQSVTVAGLGGRVYVLDGQHRIKAYEYLRGQGLPVGHVILPVVHYTVKDLNELSEYYARINQHKPVHPLELRDTWQNFDRPFVEWMVATFRPYIKKEKEKEKEKTNRETGGGFGGTRAPHIGSEQLKTEMNNRSAELMRVCRGDHRVLCDAVSSFNVHVSDLVDEGIRGGGTRTSSDIHGRVRIDEDACRRIIGCVTKKNCNTLCFLGVFRRFEWLDACMHCIEVSKRTDEHAPVRFDAETCLTLLAGNGYGGYGESDFGHRSSSSKRRPHIPHEIRQLVWNKTNDPVANVGACYTCGTELRFRDMECGHVVAHALGGSTELANLMAVCRTCNRDMGIRNLEAYRRRICEMRGDLDAESESEWDVQDTEMT